MLVQGTCRGSNRLKVILEVDVKLGSALLLLVLSVEVVHWLEVVLEVGVKLDTALLPVLADEVIAWLE
eukprot:4469402-Amphidinium_carterae.1